MENGISLSKDEKTELFKEGNNRSAIATNVLIPASRLCIEMGLSIIVCQTDQKEKLKDFIIKMGAFFEREIRLCTAIKGVTPFLMLAFLSDVGDMTRFKNVRGFNAYLGVVPTVKSSGGKTQMGHINRQSRKLARTLFTQPLSHMIHSSDMMYAFYNNIKSRRGVGRSRIAVIRKIFNIMRSVILTGEEYRWKDEENYQRKIKEFETIIHEAA